MQQHSPVIICRHYDVEWLDTDRCRCQDCGKQGFWTEQGLSIWVRTGPRLARDSQSMRPLAKVG